MPAKPKGSILLVEDDFYIRDIYKEKLTSQGHNVEVAADGEEGLAKAVEKEYALVLLDLMMPKLNGVGFLKGLKEQKAKTNVKNVVLLTNLAHDKVVKEGLALGARTYLIKTDFTPAQLADEVEKLLSGQDS